MTIAKTQWSALVILMLCVGALWWPQRVAAQYESVFVTPTDPDAYTLVDEPYLMRSYHGTLDGFPQGYTLSLESRQDITFTLTLPKHGDTPRQFSLLVVQQATSGVTEVFRENTKEMTWTTDFVARTGDTYWVSDTFTRELAPGTYYIEVSNGDNEGAYALRFGFDPPPYSLGYRHALKAVWETKQFFNKPFILVLQSPYYYVPILLLLAAWLLWRRRL